MRFYDFWIGLLLLVAVALTGCDVPIIGAWVPSRATPEMVAARTLETTATPVVVPTGTPTSTPTLTPSLIYRPLLHETIEWSANIGGKQWPPPRGQGFVVQLVDCEGPRIKIIDSSTHGPAYIDRDAVEIPAGFCSPRQDESGPKNVVIVVGGPAVYPHAAAAISNAAHLVRLSLHPGDTLAVIWLNGQDLIPALHVPLAEPVQKTPTPMPTATPCGPYDARCRATATAQTAATHPKQLKATTDESRAAIEKAAVDLEKVSLNLNNVPTSSDLLPALSRAQFLFNGTTGSDYLIIAGPLQPPSDDQLSQLKLSGAFIRFLGPDCPDLVRCGQWLKTWQNWATTTNADVAVYDEAVDLAEKVK